MLARGRMTSRCGCGGLGHPTGRLIALASARQAARYHAARRAVREVPRCQGIGRTLSGSCAMPGCGPGRTRASHRATVQTSLTRYVTFELPEQAPPCSTRSPGWHAASLSTRCNPRDRVASLIGPALPPTDPVPDRGPGARTRPRPNGTGAFVAQWRWSVLGPHDIGNRWFSSGTSGHDGYGGTAGPSSVAARTTAAGVPRRRVRIPPHRSSQARGDRT
jgi:hypothetical protein